jgi:hypothetical protein
MGYMRAYLVLTVSSSFDVARLDESHDLLFYFFYGPAKSSAHPIELDGSKRLEIQDNGPIANEIREVMDMCREVNVDIVARLSIGTQTTIMMNAQSTGRKEINVLNIMIEAQVRSLNCFPCTPQPAP